MFVFWVLLWVGK